MLKPILPLILGLIAGSASADPANTPDLFTVSCVPNDRETFQAFRTLDGAVAGEEENGEIAFMPRGNPSLNFIEIIYVADNRAILKTNLTDGRGRIWWNGEYGVDKYWFIDSEQVQCRVHHGD